MDISHLALALGSSLTAGLNLYITVLTLGLLDYFEVFQLPENMDVLSHPWVMVTAGILFLIEFIADKVPYVDNAWDAVHSFIRVPAGAILAVSALSDLPMPLIWIAALVGGFVSFSAHGAKASARLAANASPEPFSNWALSFTEDAISLGVLGLVSTYPGIALGVAAVLTVLCALFVFLSFRLLRRLFSRRPRAASSG